MIKRLLKLTLMMLICAKIQAKHIAKIDDADSNIYIATWDFTPPFSIATNNISCMETGTIPTQGVNFKAAGSTVSKMNPSTQLPLGSIPQGADEEGVILWEATPDLTNCSSGIPQFYLGGLPSEGSNYYQPFTYDNETHTWSQGTCVGSICTQSDSYIIKQVQCPDYIANSKNCFAFGIDYSSDTEKQASISKQEDLTNERKPSQSVKEKAPELKKLFTGKLKQNI